ncbi:MAG: hypothetical protein KJO82_05280 [Gammaproteobacteria bacterium]|nr:hypothetical protein [Gammaproteobacteria bacterium]
MATTGKSWVVDRLEELRTRLQGVRKPGDSIPVIQVAAISGPAMVALESGMRRSVSALLRDIEKLLRLARQLDQGPSNRLKFVNKKLTLLQLKADSLFSTFDMLQDATAIRADAKTGRLLRGVDVLLEHALRRPIPGYTAPMAIGYLDSSGRGGAIARARTRLPGGFILPTALVRVSPESLPLRLSSSLNHEVGHQLTADTSLLGDATRRVTSVVMRTTGNAAAAKLFGSWSNELMADAWSVVLGGGVPVMDGLQRVLSLPEPILYAFRPGPHPVGPVRVQFSYEASRLTFPDPALDRLRRRFDEIYGAPSVPDSLKQRLRPLLRSVPGVARALINRPFEGLGGKTLAQCGEGWRLHPRRIRRLIPMIQKARVSELVELAPLQALAALGYARVLGALPVDDLNRLASAWLGGLAERRFRGARSLDLKQRPISKSRTQTMRMMQ